MGAAWRFPIPTFPLKFARILRPNAIEENQDDSNPIGSMVHAWLVYLPTWMLGFYGKLVGKYTKDNIQYIYNMDLLWMVRHFHEPFFVSKKLIGRRNHQNQVAVDHLRFHFIIQNVRSNIIRVGVTIRYNKIDGHSQGFKLNGMMRVSHQPSTIDHRPYTLEGFTSHPDMVQDQWLHTLLATWHGTWAWIFSRFRTKTFRKINKFE